MSRGTPLASLIVALLAASVASAQDTTPPAITGFSFSPPGVDVSVTDQFVTCTITATDAGDGVKEAGCVFVSPTKKHKASCVARTRSAGTAANGTWQCNARVKKDSDEGTWTVSHAFARDLRTPKPNRVRERGTALGASTLAVTSTNEDVTDPDISAFAVTLVPDPLYSVPGGTVQCTNTATDDVGGSGILDSGCAFEDPSGNPISCITRAPLVGDDYMCSMDVPPASTPGTWVLLNTWVRDLLGNLKRLVPLDMPGIGGPSSFTVTAGAGATGGAGGAGGVGGGCTPLTCVSAFYECGVDISDGCAGLITCGNAGACVTPGEDCSGAPGYTCAPPVGVSDVNIVMNGTAPDATTWELLDANNVAVASGTKLTAGTVDVTGETGPFWVRWGWDNDHWPYPGMDSATFPVNQVSMIDRYYASNSKAAGSTFTATYGARPTNKSQMKMGFNIQKNNAYLGVDTYSDSFRSRSSNDAVSGPDWNAIWPTTDALSEFRFVSPEPGPQTFWIFWEGDGGVNIFRRGYTNNFLPNDGTDVRANLQTLTAAQGENGMSFTVDVSHSPLLKSPNATAGVLTVGPGTHSLSNIEVVHESYLGGPTPSSLDTEGEPYKCFRCIPGPDADGWYWQKGSEVTNDPAATGGGSYCERNCTGNGNWLSTGKQEMLKHTSVLRFLQHEVDVMAHPVSECTNWGTCWDTLVYHGPGRQWDDPMFDVPEQWVLTQGAGMQMRIDTCNAANTDCWFTIPAWDNPSYQTSLLAAIENTTTGLKPGLKAIIEIANEPWNYFLPYSLALQYMQHRAYHEMCITQPWDEIDWEGAATEEPTCSITPGFEDLAAKVEAGAKCGSAQIYGGAISCNVEADCDAYPSHSCIGGKCLTADDGDACLSNGDCINVCRAKSVFESQYRYIAYRQYKLAKEWWDTYGDPGALNSTTLHNRIRPVLNYQGASPTNGAFDVTVLETDGVTPLSFDADVTLSKDWLYAFATAFYTGTKYTGSSKTCQGGANHGVSCTTSGECASGNCLQCGFSNVYSSGAESEYWDYLAEKDVARDYWVNHWKQWEQSDSFLQGLKWWSYEGGGLEYNPKDTGNGCTDGTGCCAVPHDWYESFLYHETTAIEAEKTIMQLWTDTAMELFVNYADAFSLSAFSGGCDGQTDNCAKAGFYGLGNTQPDDNKQRWRGIVDASDLIAIGAVLPGTGGAGGTGGTVGTGGVGGTPPVATCGDIGTPLMSADSTDIAAVWAPSTAQTTALSTLTFAATLELSDLNGFVGIADGTQQAFDAMAIQVACGSSGFDVWQARDGTTLRNSTISCAACGNYDLVITVDVAAQTYTATIDGFSITDTLPPYDFRPDDTLAVDTQLTHYFLWKSPGPSSIDMVQTVGVPIWTADTVGGPGVCNSVDFPPLELTVSNGWDLSDPQQPASGLMTFSAYVRSTAGGNAFVAIDDTTSQTFSDMAGIVQFHTSGEFAAFDGTDTIDYNPGYCNGAGVRPCSNTITWEPDTWYKITFDVDRGAGTYTARVGECDGVQQNVVTDAEFRQAPAGNLAFYKVWSAFGTTIDLDTPIWTAN